MDVVFYGGSLNYDQGSGNYQELKKITKWDGRQYTLVSRYALRYSMLETARKMGLWKIADADKLQLAGDANKKVIQPSTEVLLTGEILDYPEFDLFGYLVTSTTPQNFKIAPVKISHAISMTPFNYDALFNANLGLANRMRKVYGEMKPNPFTAEEHETFYQYTVVIDVDNIGEVEVYLTKNKEITLKDDKDKWKIDSVKKDSEKIKIFLRKGKNTKPIEQKDINIDGELLDLKDAYVIKYLLQDPKKIEERIKELVKIILNLKRSIKGRDEDLSPKLLVVGIYKDHPYKTYKDKIFLKDEYSEENYDEIEEKEDNGKKIVKVRHIVSKSKKPVFEVVGDKFEQELTEISENKVVKFILELFKNNNEKASQNINEEDNKICKAKVFYDPSIKVEVKELDRKIK